MADEDWPLPRQPATARALITDQTGRLLIVNRLGDRHWYLPGGLIEQDEQPTLACAREVFEEVGLVITVGEPLVIEWHAKPRPGKFARFSLLFAGGVVDSTQPLQLRDHEVGAARWVMFGEALDVLTPAIAERLRAWKATSPPRCVYVEHAC